LAESGRLSAFGSQSGHPDLGPAADGFGEPIAGLKLMPETGIEAVNPIFDWGTHYREAEDYEEHE
jgi:hypothetical protein